MKILVTGGAGYIGSFMVRFLLDRNYEVTVLDSLDRGSLNAVDKKADFLQIDIKDLNSLENLFSKRSFDFVFHFAGLISVEESSRDNQKYYETNVVGSDNLFNSAIKIGKIKNFIFSSSAAIYGNPIKIPISEDHPKNPTSFYGKTKLETEEKLSALRLEDNSISFANLRYFNAAGASLDGKFGENHTPIETHLIPNVINSLLNESEFNLYGTDYKTPDGTCIRDYIHVLDLCEAHLLAMEKINNEKGEYFYNVGTGKGFSNREVLEMVESVAGKKIKVVEKDRRMGDADELVADISKIEKELGFSPKYSDLNTIVKTAWAWHNNRK